METHLLNKSAMHNKQLKRECDWVNGQLDYWFDGSEMPNSQIFYALL